MYNKELELMIEMALKDGVLREKDKQVLIRKAYDLGIDLVRFEASLNARLLRKGDVVEAKSNIKKPMVAEKSSIKKPSEIFKCPSCAEIIPPLTRVCPTCQYVILNAESDSHIDLIFDDIENTLVLIKSLPRKSFSFFLFKYFYLVFIISSVFLLLVSIRADNGVLFFAAAVLAIIGYIVYLNVTKKKDITGDKKLSFLQLKAQFSKQKRNVEVFYGDNKRIKLLLNEINDEFNKIEVHRKSYLLWNQISLCLIICTLTATYFIIPNKQAGYKLERESDARLSEEIENLISKRDFNQASIEILKISASNLQVKYKSEIQFLFINEKLDSIKLLIDRNQFVEAKKGLSNIRWDRKSEDRVFLVESENYNFIKFMKYYNHLNSLLPEELRVKPMDYNAL